MADLKPIGSEKLQGQDKLNRILEIARYKENIPKTVNETAKVEFGKTLSDGNQYEIVKEKGGYVLMKRINESLDYIEPMKNRRHYKSYSQALKRLNLMAGEINRLTENVEEVSMFRVDEEKKFTLKLPKPSTPEPAPAPEVSMDTEMDMTAAPDMGDEEMSMDTEVSMDSPADTEPILSEEDKEDILAKFEDTETDYDMDMDMNMDNSSESDFDFDMDSEETVDSEMSEDRDSFDGRDSEVVGVYSNINKQRKEMGETESKVSSIMDSIFAESKVDKVLSSYFVLSESEIEKSEKQKLEVDSKMSKVKKLSETIEQELAAEFIIKENSELKLLGKTNKNNLVFESNGEQFRISPKGELL